MLDVLADHSLAELRRYRDLLLGAAEEESG
jgi:hypothetical protein